MTEGEMEHGQDDGASRSARKAPRAGETRGHAAAPVNATMAPFRDGEPAMGLVERAWVALSERLPGGRLLARARPAAAT